MHMRACMCVHLIVIFLEIAIVNIPKTPPHHHLQDIHAAVEALLVAVTNALALLSIKLVEKKTIGVYNTCI
jgi:Na+-translocating ferredoxin:NAD+ oxidoreductase RnfD subunit